MRTAHSSDRRGGDVFPGVSDQGCMSARWVSAPVHVKLV